MNIGRLRLERGRMHSVCCLVLIIAATPAAGQTASRAQPQWQLWTINADGTGLARFAETPGYSCGSPQWSPDGTMVAYDKRRIEEDLLASQAAVIRADGTDLRLLGPGSMPSWSPDGTHLVFHAYDPHAIVVMKADGTGRETILDHGESPRWLHVGNRIASIGSNGDIALFDLSTGRERTLLSGPYSIRPGFAVSPDGYCFCFDDGRGGVYLATFDSRMLPASVRVLVQGGICYHASWSPDGKRLVFEWWPTVGNNPFCQLFMLDVDSGAAPLRLEGQNPLRNNTNPDWAPDGKTIIFASQDPMDTLLPGDLLESLP